VGEYFLFQSLKHFIALEIIVIFSLILLFFKKKDWKLFIFKIGIIFLTYHLRIFKILDLVILSFLLKDKDDQIFQIMFLGVCLQIIYAPYLKIVTPLEYLKTYNLELKEDINWFLHPHVLAISKYFLAINGSRVLFYPAIFGILLLIREGKKQKLITFYKLAFIQIFIYILFKAFGKELSFLNHTPLYLFSINMFSIFYLLQRIVNFKTSNN